MERKSRPFRPFRGAGFYNDIEKLRREGKHGQAITDSEATGLSYHKQGPSVYARWRGMNKATGKRDDVTLGRMPTSKELFYAATAAKRLPQNEYGLELEKVRARARLLRQRSRLRGAPDNAPVDPAPGTRTMADLADAYLRHAEPHLRAKSVKDALNRVRRVIKPLLGSRPVQAVTKAELQDLHTGLSLTPYEANRVRALLSVMFGQAVEWGWRADNPVQGIKPYVEAKREKWLNEEQLGRLIAALRTHPNKSAARALLLLTYTGTRKSEVLSATWDQFDLEAKTWTKPSHHTKQKKLHHVPLNSDAMARLNEMREECSGKGYLFPGKIAGKPVNDLKRFWGKFTKEAGFEGFRMHDLRHSYASVLVSKGVSLPIVGELLGHTQAKTTQRYAHLATKDLAEAGETFTKVLRGKPVRHGAAQRRA
jgi:integrase